MANNNPNQRDTDSLALSLAKDYLKRNKNEPHEFDSRVVFVGAGMGKQTHLNLGNEAIDEIEKRLILENAIEGMADASAIHKRLAEENLISKKTYETALNDVKQGMGNIAVDADFEMRMEALCQGHGMENAVRLLKAQH
jgi:hypothetical protein